MEVELVTRKENREYGIDLEKNICPQFDRLKLKYEQDTQEDCLGESPSSREICAIVLVPLFESGNVGKHKQLTWRECVEKRQMIVKDGISDTTSIFLKT